jgi:hypothetical protein
MNYLVERKLIIYNYFKTAEEKCSLGKKNSITYNKDDLKAFIYS